MNLTRILTTTGLAAALSFTSAVAFAGPGAPLQRALRQLDLTEEQRAGIREILADARQEREATREATAALRERFRDEIARATPDPDVLHDLVDERMALRTAAAHDRVEDLLAIHALLTEEQRAMLADHLTERPAEGVDARPRRRAGPHGG